MKRDLNQREKVLIMVTLAVLALAYIKYWYMPKWSQLSTLQIEVSSLEAQVQANREILQHLQNRAPASSASNKPDLEIYLQNNKSFSKLLQELSEPYKDNAFQIRRLVVEKNETKDQIHLGVLEMEVEASFMDVGAFLEKLENSPYLTEVLNVEISRIDRELKRCFAKIRLQNFLLESSQ